jgi:VWFA-related protein
MKTNITLIVVLLASIGAIAHAQSESSPRVTGQEKAAGAEVQINQIDASQFPKVSIFATVLKDGEPVPGLSAGDFRVREDEVDQEPITVTPKLTPLSVVLTMDTSGSMKKRLADAQSAAKSFLKTLQSQDKAQVIRFARDVKTIQPLSADRAAAEAAIDATTARGDTALFDALYTSVESLRDVPGRKAIVLLSDGVDDDGTGKSLSKKTVTDVLTLARRVNVPIYAIGLGTELDELALKKVASETGALYLNAVEPSELKRLYDSIGKQLAGQYTIGYSSNLPADGAEHRVQLRYAGMTSAKTYIPAATGVGRRSTPVLAATPAVEKVKRIGRMERTVTVLQPVIELPEMKELLVVTAGAADNPNAYLPPDTAGKSTKYGEPIRLAPDAKAEKFDVYWMPKKGKRLPLMKEIVFDAEHASYEINPEEHMGIVRLASKDSPKAKAIYLAEAGTDKLHVRLFSTQSTEASGENMAAPPGTYDLYIDVADENRLELIAERIEVKPGKVTEVE